MDDPRIAELDEIAACAVDAVERETLVDAAVPSFLLRRYLDAGGDPLGGALGLALTQSLACAAADETAAGRAGWLTLFVEATAVADDERIVSAIAGLIAALRAAWPGQSRIHEACASIEACLRAAEIVEPGDLMQDAIDHLEHLIGGRYRPGEGLVDGSLDDHVLAASALLTAFELTGRLPYSMLAEELAAIARLNPDGATAIRCTLARVLCRLASLHANPEYRGAAVITEGADFRADASRILAAESARARAGSPSAAAAYGLALFDLLK